MNYLLYSLPLIAGFLLYSKRVEIFKFSLKFFKKREQIEDYLIPNTNILKIPIANGFIYLPFNRDKIFDMCTYDVNFLDENNDSHNITQIPGIPYHFSSNDLRVNSIQVFNGITQELHSVDEDEVLGYLDKF